MRFRRTSTTYEEHALRIRETRRFLRGGASPRTEAGQASLEYLLVSLALVAMIAALGTLWHAVADGRFAEVAETGVSHALSMPEGVADALFF